MSIPVDELLDPGHDLYQGDGEYAVRARQMREIFQLVDEIIYEVLFPLRLELRVVIGRVLGRQARLAPDLQSALRTALDVQRTILVQLNELAAMLEDPALRWFMKVL